MNRDPGASPDPSPFASGLPFDAYPGAGRRLLGRPPQGDVTARHGYGPPVFEICGYTCVYCGLEMASSYGAWLQISIDHVIPRSAGAQGWSATWLEDRVNLVTCCRACNEFTNAYEVHDPTPDDEAGFFALRDRHFRAKRDLARAAHARDRAWYQLHVVGAGDHG